MVDADLMISCGSYVFVFNELKPRVNLFPFMNLFLYQGSFSLIFLGLGKAFLLH